MFQLHCSILPTCSLQRILALFRETSYFMKTSIKPLRFFLQASASHHPHTVSQMRHSRVLRQKEKVALLNQWSGQYGWPLSKSANSVNYIMSASVPNSYLNPRITKYDDNLPSIAVGMTEVLNCWSCITALRGENNTRASDRLGGSGRLCTKCFCFLPALTFAFVRGYYKLSHSIAGKKHIG